MGAKAKSMVDSLHNWVQKHLWISGRVQGVGFRAATLREAARHPQIIGMVRNTADGRVEAIFCGPEEDVEALVAWCHHGPSRSEVTNVDVRDERVDAKVFCGFELRD